MSVNKDPKTGLWCCQIRYIDKQGKKRHTTRNGFKCKRDAISAERLFLQSIKEPTEKMLSLIQDYKTHLTRMVELRNIKRSTLHNKINYIERYIEPFFKDLLISQISPSIIDHWLVNLAKSSKYNRPKSSGTVRNARSILNQIFEYGIRNYVLLTNPVVHSQKPKKYTNDNRVKHITKEEYKKFYEKIPNTKQYYKVLFNILMYSGLRIGEALALKPLDIGDDVIYVSKTLIYNKNGSYCDTPKSLSSNRCVPVPNWLTSQIHEYVSKHNISESESIFSISESSARHYLKYNSQRYGLPKISPHTLRHSYASMLYAISKNMAIVSNVMGHSNTATTARMYLHSDKESAQDAVKLLSSPDDT